MHVVLSPDPEMIEEFLYSMIEEEIVTFIPSRKRVTATDFIQRLREKAVSYLYAKSNLEPAGILLFHPYRPNERYYEERGKERREEEERLDKEIKKWDWILSKENWREYVTFSPHFHFEGYIGWLAKPKEGEEFVYKLIPNKNGKYTSITDKNELYKLNYYLLSHTGKERGSEADSYIWIGNLSYRYGKHSSPPKKKKEKVKSKCKLCGGALGCFYPTLKAFFKVWLNIPLEKWERSIKMLKMNVLYASLPKNIKRNVLEALTILQTGKPPPDYEKFLIE